MNINKIKKTVFLSSRIALICGIILMLISMIIVNFDVKALDTCGEPEKTVKEYISDNIESININIRISDIVLKKSNNDKIKITYYTTECCPQQLENVNGNITLKDNSSDWEFNYKQFTKGFFHGWKRYRLKTIVEIPQKCAELKINIDSSLSNVVADNITADTIKIYTSNGNINISDTVCTKNILDTNNGNITINNSSADNIRATTSNGSIDISNINKANQILKISTSNGKIGLKNISVDEINANTSNGKIEIYNLQSNHCKLKTSNGRIMLTDVKATDTLYADTSNGQITVANILSNNIHLETSNGRIDGNILGKAEDYNISSDTSNGNNSLWIYNNKNLNSDKELEVYTSNGNIEIIFTEE